MNQNRLRITVLTYYFLPLLLFIGYAYKFLPREGSWAIAVMGMTVVCFGTIALLLNLFRMEHLHEPAAPVAPPLPVNVEAMRAELEDLTRREAALRTEIEEVQRSQDSKQLESRELQKALENLEHEYNHLLETSQEQLKKRDVVLTEYSQTIRELQTTMDNKQQQISELEHSVNDLTYDVDTLLKLTDAGDVIEEGLDDVKEGTSATKRILINPYQQLKQCINTAQKLTGTAPFGGPRLRDMGMDHQALDQRRLYDNYRSETGALIVVYSPKERKVIFANDQTEDFLGWKPEKFVRDFNSIVQEGTWEHALAELGGKSEAEARLVLENVQGEPSEMKGYLGTIPTGVFKHQIVGVLTP